MTSSADGLVRPLNAPQGQQVLPGVQPGTSGGVTTAQYVIIFSAAGTAQAGGMFIYSGSPGPGNLPVFSITSATEDPYGNPVASGIFAGQFGGPQAGLDLEGLLGQVVMPTGAAGEDLAGGMASAVNPSGASFLQIFGAQGPAAGNNNDRAILTFFNSTGGGGAVWELVYNSLVTSTAIGQMTGDFSGVTANYMKALAAVLPGTGTDVTNPAQPETWHNLTVDAGWTVVDQPQYRLLPGIGVQVSGLITHAGTTAQTNINNSSPVGTAYRPSTTRYYRTPMPSPDFAGSVQIQPTGVFVMRASGFSATQAIMDGIYRL